MSGLVRPNVHRLFKQLEFLEPDELTDGIEEDPLEGTILHGLLALQLPLTGVEFQRLRELDRIPGPSVAEFVADVDAQCPMAEEGSVLSGWLRENDNGHSMLLLIECARVHDLEGGGPFLQLAPQLLVYDADGRLLLLVGFGQVSRYLWSNEPHSSLLGGETINGYGIPGARIGPG